MVDDCRSDNITPWIYRCSETVGKRHSAVRNQLDELVNEWPEDKDSYPFIVYALYKRRVESLQFEIELLSWLENMLTGISGDVLHMTWGEARVQIINSKIWLKVEGLELKIYELWALNFELWNGYFSSGFIEKN